MTKYFALNTSLPEPERYLYCTKVHLTHAPNSCLRPQRFNIACMHDTYLYLSTMVFAVEIGQLTLENDFLESALTKAGLLSAKK
jgi:hypothetical protein